MKIALVGTAPASIGLAPYSDPTWQIWGCSPGAYYRVPRSDVWFEIHRWEPPVLGRPEQQKPWFSPEYVGWLYTHPCVYGFDLPKEMPGAKQIPHVPLRAKYGDFNFTSTLAWMFAMAIECILQERKEAGEPGEHAIGLWGVDMAASEEYGYQKAGCQFFTQIARALGINVVVPPESDLLTAPPLYGLHEKHPRHVKLLARKAEIEGRLGVARANKANLEREEHFLMGALDDITYMMNTWMHDEPARPADFAAIFGEPIEPDA